jgi:hypothetical protein
MPDYQQGKIYTIRCRTDDTLIYVGSTIQPLCERFAQHKRNSKQEKQKSRLIFRTINEDWDNWYIELYELYPCNCKEELCKKEGEIIRLIATLNTEIAGRTHTEWRQDNKEKQKEYNKKLENENIEKRKEQKKKRYEIHKEEHAIQMKKWYENNKDKLREKITCECGCLICMGDLKRHHKSQKHINLMNQQQSQQ